MTRNRSFVFALTALFATAVSAHAGALFSPLASEADYQKAVAFDTAYNALARDPAAASIEVVRANPDDPFFIDIAQIKVSACEMAIDVTSKALQVCGGTAYKRGHPCERHYRDARAGSVMAPSDDAVKLIMGRQILGIEQPWE